MKTAPSFPFYAGDFIMGTMLMSAEEVGAYIRLLCWQWEQGQIPDCLTKTSKIAGIPEKKLGPVLEKFHRDAENRLVNKRMELVRIDRQHFVDIQRAKGRLGGRPRNPQESHGKPPALPQVSQTKANESLPPRTPIPVPSPIISLDGDESQPGSEPEEQPKDPKNPFGLTERQLVLCEMIGRRPTTKWADAEVKKLRKIEKELDEDDFNALRWYYVESGCACLRQDLSTLLNNWPGEIDRARKYDPEKDRSRK